MPVLVRALSVLSVFTLSIVLFACPPAMVGTGSGSGNDDDGGGALGGLDTNGDGVLTPEDVASGRAALYVVRVDEGAESEDAQTLQARILVGDGVYGLSFSLPGAVAWDIVIWFEDPDFDDFELSPGSTQIAWVNVSDPSEEWLAWASEQTGTIEITESNGASASGYFEGSIAISIADRFEQPTGEELLISAFAFSDVTVEGPQ